MANGLWLPVGTFRREVGTPESPGEPVLEGQLRLGLAAAQVAHRLHGKLPPVLVNSQKRGERIARERLKPSETGAPRRFGRSSEFAAPSTNDLERLVPVAYSDGGFSMRPRGEGELLWDNRIGDAAPSLG